VENENSFVIKIKKDSHGNDISLNHMPLEATEALVIFVQNLVGFAKQQKVVNSDDVRISIKNGCIQSELIYPATREDIDERIFSIVEGNSEENDLIKFFKAIQDKVKLNGLDYSIHLNQNGINHDLTSKFKNKRFPLKRGKRVEWEYNIDFIEGQLFNAGGKSTTNIHIDLEDEPIVIACTKDQAKAVNKFLYERAYLCVESKRKAGAVTKYNLVDYYISKEAIQKYQSFFCDMNEKSLEVRYETFHEFVQKTISESDFEMSLKKIRKHIRLFDNRNTEQGMLRTILVTLKSFKNSEILSDDLSKIANRLRELTGKNKI
jgi:hypothetical protein